MLNLTVDLSLLTSSRHLQHVSQWLILLHRDLLIHTHALTKRLGCGGFLGPGT